MRALQCAGKVVLLAGCLWLGAARSSVAQAPVKDDPWRPVRFLVGEWTGESTGEPGQGTVRRTYRFVLGDKFLHEQNVSTYPPQPNNPKGEVHEHWAFFSYDRARKALVLRQLHQESFVNQYVMLAEAKANTVVFETEALENLPSGWKARERYEVVSPDEFVETFELAEPGSEFKLYSRSRFKRASGAVARD
jgi:hypothetical protein